MDSLSNLIADFNNSFHLLYTNLDTSDQEYLQYIADNDEVAFIDALDSIAQSTFYSESIDNLYESFDYFYRNDSMLPFDSIFTVAYEKLQIVIDNPATAVHDPCRTCIYNALNTFNAAMMDCADRLILEILEQFSLTPGMFFRFANCGSKAHMQLYSTLT